MIFEKDVDNQFKRLDLKRVEQVLDRIYKQCRQLKPMGVKFDSLKATVKF